MRNTIQKMVILAKAEPKQSITLGVVTILALGFWARTTVKQGADAHASSGNTTSTAEVRENNTADEQRERIVIASADTTSRDLFLPRPEDFPRLCNRNLLTTRRQSPPREATTRRAKPRR